MILEYTLQVPSACISKIYKKGMNQFFIWFGSKLFLYKGIFLEKKKFSLTFLTEASLIFRSINFMKNYFYVNANIFKLVVINIL